MGYGRSASVWGKPGAGTSRLIGDTLDSLMTLNGSLGVLHLNLLVYKVGQMYLLIGVFGTFMH